MGNNTATAITIPYIIVPTYKAYLDVPQSHGGDNLTGLQLFLGALLAGIATLLFLISTVAWRRTKSMKIGLISLAFLIFSLKGIYLTYTGMLYGWMAENTLMLIMDMGAIALMYFSVLKG